MQSATIYEKLQQIFPHHIQNLHPNQLNSLSSSSSLQSLFNKKLSHLPQLPISQLHLLCCNQQKNIMQKVLEIKQMDLYDEMATICPNKDLKLMKTYSQEEVNQKIQHYQSQIVIMAQRQEKMLVQRQYSDDGNEDSEESEDSRCCMESMEKMRGFNQHNIMMDQEVNGNDGMIGHHQHDSMEEEVHQYNDHRQLRNIFQEYDRTDQNVLLWPPFDHHIDYLH